ncbi:MAG: DNA-binding domain-containing protein [Bacteroidales bacterium]|nr:DNA-binding domain-containing protein [Bacteroidales bacterium]
MAAKYDLYENPDNKTRESGYHPRLLKTQPAMEDEICTSISNSCSVTKSDIAGVMEAIYGNLITNLKMGRSVYIPKLGRFSISLECEKLDDYNSNPQNLHVKQINFKPDKRLKEDMKNMEFSRYHREKK